MSPDENAPVDPALLRQPTDAPRDDHTFVLESPVGPATSPLLLPPSRATARPGGQTICPTCGRKNSAEQERWCEWCGADMRPPVRYPEPRPIPPINRPPRRRLWIGFALVVAAVLVVLAGGGIALLTRGTKTPEGPPVSTKAEVVATIAASRISATASSTLPRDPRFVIGNTLDGQESTAWESNGRKIPSGRGITLTYTFDRPVDLRSITIRNGYVDSPTLGKAGFDANARMKTLSVRTDAGEHTWELKDDPDPQSLSISFGTTRQVQLVVQKIYSGNHFHELALTDISFAGVG